MIEWVECDEPEYPEPPDPKPDHVVTNRHWLEVWAAVDDGDGKWDTDGMYEFTVYHECEWINGGGYWVPGCALQMEIENYGSEVFCPDEDYWPTPPFKVEIKHFYSTYRDYWGDYDVESYVEIVK